MIQSNSYRSSRQNTNFNDHTPIEKVLERLELVRRTGDAKWQSRCPAHDDRSPSLSIREGNEETVLLKCWAGCSVEEIVEAIGLKLADLFPSARSYSPSKEPRYNAKDVVQTLLLESTIIVLAYQTLQRGDELNQSDKSRIDIALRAIEECRRIVR